MPNEGRFQIGEVADSVGLSIRTIRHYDELGVVAPSGRSSGGFRLYTDDDVERLRLVKRLKPLQFSLEEIIELLALLDAVEEDRIDHAGRVRLDGIVAAARDRCDELREQLRAAEDVVVELGRTVPTGRSRRAH